MLTCVLLWLPRVFMAAMLSRSVRKYLQTNIKLFYLCLFLVQSQSNLPERFLVEDKQQVAPIQHGRHRLFTPSVLLSTQHLHHFTPLKCFHLFTL